MDCSGNDQVVRKAPQGFRRHEAYRELAKSLFPERLNFFVVVVVFLLFFTSGIFVDLGVALRWNDQILQ